MIRIRRRARRDDTRQLLTELGLILGEMPVVTVNRLAKEAGVSAHPHYAHELMGRVDAATGLRNGRRR